MKLRRRRGLGLLTVVTLVAVTVLALGWIVARDLGRSADDAEHLYGRLSEGLDLIEELEFKTQEVRRILLYALHTSDANLQLQYAEQSRAADAEVQQLLSHASSVMAAPQAQGLLENVSLAWAKYLVVRDDVIGLILEGSLPEGVSLDQHEGEAAFGAVRQAVSNLEVSFESEAAVQVAEARARAQRATLRLTLLVVSALFVAAVGIYLVNRRTALEGLLRSEAHKGSILQAVPDPIVSADATGRIIEFNEAAERAFGVRRDEALGARVDELILPKANRGALASLLAGAAHVDRAATPRIQTTGVRRNGTEFPMGLAVSTHTAGRDRIFTLHIADLTAAHQAEEQLRRAKEAAEVADRAKGDFLATMSHELRTPLTGVIGIADLLERADLAAPQRELVRMLRSSATALLGLVGDILDYTRIEAGMMDLVPRPFSLHTCVEDALDTVAEPAARKGLEIGYLIDPEVPSEIISDQDRVRQVLINLLSNGVKFTDAGEVSVHVGVTRTDAGHVTFRVRVRDTGRGIPEELHPKLFHRFTHVDSSVAGQQRGAGLGLAISERLSRLLGGSLGVESAPGRGSTFTFVFDATLPPHRAPDALGGSLAGLRVLAFLDAGIAGDQIQALLRRWGATAVVVTDDARSSLDLGETPVDAVLVDVDAREGRLDALAQEHLRRAQSNGIPLIRVARVVRADTRLHDSTDLVVTKPIRGQALHAALYAAARPATLASRPSGRPAAELPVPASLAILVAEDDDANRRVMQLMLAELGLTIDEATSGTDAVACARARQYDVIFMDVHMPGLDGLEATRQIRAAQRDRSPVIIALTASVLKGEEARCRQAGMDGYLPKPLRLESLERVLAPFTPHPRDEGPAGPAD